MKAEFWIRGNIWQKGVVPRGPGFADRKVSIRQSVFPEAPLWQVVGRCKIPPNSSGGRRWDFCSASYQLMSHRQTHSSNKSVAFCAKRWSSLRHGVLVRITRNGASAQCQALSEGSWSTGPVCVLGCIINYSRLGVKPFHCASEF